MTAARVTTLRLDPEVFASVEAYVAEHGLSSVSEFFRLAAATQLGRKPRGLNQAGVVLTPGNPETAAAAGRAGAAARWNRQAD